MGLGESHSYRVIDAAHVVENIKLPNRGGNGRTCDQILPVNESQARPLTQFDADTQCDLWQKAVDRSIEKGTGKVTGSIVSSISAEYLRKQGTEKIKDLKKRSSREKLISDTFHQNLQVFVDTIASEINTGFKTTSKVTVLKYLDEIRSLVTDSK